MVEQGIIPCELKVCHESAVQVTKGEEKRGNQSQNPDPNHCGTLRTIRLGGGGDSGIRERGGFARRVGGGVSEAASLSVAESGEDADG